MQKGFSVWLAIVCLVWVNLTSSDQSAERFMLRDDRAHGMNQTEREREREYGIWVK